MNFALLLVTLSALSGAIILLDKLFWARKRPDNTPRGRLIEYAYSFFPVFFVVLLLRSFLMEPFRIPSGSLEPTLLVGDFVAVNKFSYGLRWPVIEKKWLSIAEPKRGEIAVFRWPPNPKLDYIKRVVGVPGDHIEYRQKTLFINGKAAPQTFVKDTIDESSGMPVGLYKEQLNGIEHAIYIRRNVPSTDFSIDVPAGYYFMLGDNRDDSADSRYWGLVPDSYLRGKAILVWMSWDSKAGMPRWHQLGRWLKGTPVS